MAAAGTTSLCFSHGLTRSPALTYLQRSSASHGWSECIGHARIGLPWLRLSMVEFQPQWLMNAAVAPCARISSCGAHPVITSPVPSVSLVNSESSLSCRLSPGSLNMSARSASRNTQMNLCLLPLSAAASSAICSPRRDDVVPKDT
ncbi:hypothetical protein VPH35_030714 [Triticum aestivum]